MLYFWCLSYFCSQHYGLPISSINEKKEITWKNFQQLVQNDKIESVEVNQNKSVPTGRVEITLKGDDDPIRSDICMFLMLTRSRII